MGVLGALQIASKVTVKGISLLNFGIFQNMSDTKIAGLSSIHKLTVSASVLAYFINLFTSVHV